MSREKNAATIKFSHFVEKFPKVDLPIVLTTESHHTFSEENLPFPAPMITQFIEPMEGQGDEFTEYVPCFKVPIHKKKIYALVYWKASLLNYEYILVTFDKKGNLLSRKIIAGTKADGDSLIRSVATFKEDGSIVMVGGVAKSQEEDIYNASESQAIQLELLENGQIIALN